MKDRLSHHSFVILLAMTAFSATLAWSQQISKLDRDRAKEMLADISGDIKKHYYDPKLHGLDWDAKVRETRDKIDQSPSLNMAIFPCGSRTGRAQ